MSLILALEISFPFVGIESPTDELSGILVPPLPGSAACRFPKEFSSLEIFDRVLTLQNNILRYFCWWIILYPRLISTLSE